MTLATSCNAALTKGCAVRKGDKYHGSKDCAPAFSQPLTCKSTVQN